MTAISAGTRTPARSPFAGLRVLIVHEWLYTWAGAERCLEEILLMLPDADLVVGTVTDDARARYPVAARAVETWLGRVPGARRYHRWFLPLHALAFAMIDTSRYDLVVSLSHSMGKLTMRRKGGAHLCYCHSPPRYLWDLGGTYGEQAPLAQAVALRIARVPLRAIDRWGAARVDRFVSNSRCVADRVRRAYGRNSDVVYPPVSAKSTIERVREPFLLSLGRLVPYKRVDLAIRAAELLQMKLIVAGDGPERARLEKMAGRYTEFRGEVSEDEAGRLLASCTAFVFCAEEDFGIAPVEANAEGTPVVAFGRGGAAESIVDGKTGILFSSQTESDVAAAIEQCLRRSWSAEVLRANAARFSPERFREGMAVQISAAAAMIGNGKLT